jgi:hypothetical protein
MGISLKQEQGDTYYMRITGLLKKSELDAMQAASAKVFDSDQSLRIKVMIIIVNFQGWERGADWGDLKFYSKYGERITRIGIIGDPKRETEFRMFLGAGYRSAPVRFFPPDQLSEAREWLAEND